MIFDENLPEQCPPSDCDCSELDGMYRVLESSELSVNDWLSHAQKKKPCPNKVDPCRWGSLSLQANLPAVEKLLKLPNFRNATHAAILTIPSEAGFHKLNGNHIDFWKDIAANMNDYVVAVSVVRHAAS